MLDFRIHTFLSVCEHMSFTKAAHELHLTQPAVSHHMHALQELYGQELFTIVGRQVVLTEAGNRFRTFTQSLHLDVNRFIKEFSQVSEIDVVKFGATLTIGEFTLPPIIHKLMQNNPNRKLTMHVDNTENLLAMIDSGHIDFAFIEGAFDKNSYGYRLFSNERFIAIGSHACKARHPHPTLEELLGEQLLIRETGSGTRAVLERILAERGLSVGCFCHLDEIGNLNVIKQLVGSDNGISFLYEAAARQALQENNIVELEIGGWSVMREFNFVFSLDSRYESRFLHFLDECISNMNPI
ncbi:MAG: LysR family transcriptional regulator [Spirochaetae bacterium HGW-Spirochaetae-4]|jgi:DNA-binding transcriptional LysR family regulator|nr:MAG: LysR family transcriptional regulator [Spirochaetae bacterium HGW-Spirochaetae-4]